MKRCKMFMISLLLIAAVAGVQTAGAADLTWDGGTADWTSAANWGGAVPTVGDNANIPSGTVTSSAQLRITSNVAAADNKVTTLTLSGGTLDMGANALIAAPSGSDNVTFTQTAGAITQASGEIFCVGDVGTGAYTQTGGAITVGGLQIGGYYPNTGTAGAGSGTATFTGGTITLAGGVLSGVALGTGSGTLILDGVTLNQTDTASANRFYLGRNGPGTVTIQNGGVFNVTGQALILAYNGGANRSGTLNVMPDGTFSTNRQFTIGQGGNGTSTSSTGTLNLLGGTVNYTSTSDLRVGYNGVGILNMTGGTLNSAGNIIVSNGGALADPSLSPTLRNGQMMVSGGTLTVAAGRNITLAQANDATWTQSGGVISTPQLLKGPGNLTAFNWTGGTLSANTINLGGTVCLNDGGTLSPAGDGIGTTTFTATNYTQTAAGVLEIGLSGTAGDSVLLNNSAGNIAGTINITHTGALPPNGTQWDIITTTNGGTVNISAATVVFPFPARDWAVDTATPGKVTVIYSHIDTPRLSHDADTTITFAPIYLSLAQTSQDATFTITNAGELDLNISSIVANPSSATEAFSVVSPAAPLTITPGNSEPVTLRFIGTIDGRYLGTLTIASNDPDFPEIVINLVGIVRDETDPAAVKEWWLY